MKNEYVAPNGNDGSSDTEEFDLILKHQGKTPVSNLDLEPIQENWVYSHLLTFQQFSNLPGKYMNLKLSNFSH